MPKAVYSEFGTDEVQSPADETVQGFIDQLKNEIIAKTGPTDALKAIHYYKRVHGAPIYYVKVNHGDGKFCHVTFMLPRYNKPGPATLSDVSMDKTDNDPVQAFGLHFD